MVDLQGQYQEIKENVNTAIDEVLNTSAISMYTLCEYDILCDTSLDESCSRIASKFSEQNF